MPIGRRTRWVVLLLVAGLLPVASPADTKYRERLKKYWKKQFKEDGFSPLYYASTAHAPKSVWVKGEDGVDFFTSGLDLYPEDQVKIVVREIDLPGQKGSRETKVSAALQMLGVKDVSDPDFNAAVDSNLTWIIEAGEAELHYFSKREARRCERTVTAEVLADYFVDVGPGEKLFVVVKAVYVRNYRVKVVAGSSMQAGLTGVIGGFLQALGFEFSRDKKTATSLVAKEKFVAVGLRELTKDEGLKMLAGEGPELEELPELISLPEYVEVVD